MKKYERLPLKELNPKQHNEIKKFISKLRKDSKKYLNKNYFKKYKYEKFRNYISKKKFSKIKK